MTSTAISYSDARNIALEAIRELYASNDWSAAKKPTALHNDLLNSHSLWTAWDGDRLIGLGNAISDGHLVVYYPHLLVHPDYQRRGIVLYQIAFDVDGPEERAALGRHGFRVLGGGAATCAICYRRNCSG